jgi:hypothetical protein
MLGVEKLIALSAVQNGALSVVDLPIRALI